MKKRFAAVVLIVLIVLVELHRPGGDLVYINPDQVQGVTTNVRGSAPGATDVVMSDGHVVHVLEPPEEVVKKLREGK
jgi:hypothetical protein